MVILPKETLLKKTDSVSYQSVINNPSTRGKTLCSYLCFIVELVYVKTVSCQLVTALFCPEFTLLLFSSTISGLHSLHTLLCNDPGTLGERYLNISFKDEHSAMFYYVWLDQLFYV